MTPTVRLAALATVLLAAACGDNLTIADQSDACHVRVCNAPEAPHCDGDVLITPQPGVCTDVGGVAQCTYDELQTDCTAVNDVCANGACRAPDDPCAMTSCNTPPAPSCDAGGVATTYPSTGTCSSDTGSAVCSYAPTHVDCTAMDLACDGGVCIDPCDAASCITPPADSCTDFVATHYANPGTCSSPDGEVTCDYAPATVDCSESDRACSAGACVDPCIGFACDSPPADACTDFVATHYAATGTCTSPGGVPSCIYAPTTTDCAAIDQACAAGACVDPCIGFACNTPPADVCQDASILTDYPAAGTCGSPGGVPACTYTPTATDCNDSDQVCSAGACVDPCATATCNTPPAATCVVNVARTFSPTGTCSSPDGIVTCDYGHTDTDCSLTGQTCNAGACTGPSLFCRVQSPETITDVAGTLQTVYGRMYIAGITDVSGTNDPIGPNVQIQFGLGTGTDPTAYAYSAAIPNPAYGPGSPGYEANNDEYQAGFLVPAAPGTTQRYAYRLSNDSGATWLYCDTGNAGSSDGFTTPGTLNIAAPFFSEYVEGSSNNKAIEIYNPGSVPFDLAAATCSLQLFTNGSSTVSSTSVLTGTIGAGDVRVICNASSSAGLLALCDATASAVNWNGNDAVRLVCGAGVTVYDVIGKIGEDPGALGWGADPTTTTNHTLRRKCGVFAGDTNGTDTFDPATQYVSFAVDTFTGLGDPACAP